MRCLRRGEFGERRLVGGVAGPWDCEPDLLTRHFIFQSTSSAYAASCHNKSQARHAKGVPLVSGAPKVRQTGLRCRATKVAVNRQRERREIATKAVASPWDGELTLSLKNFIPQPTSSASSASHRNKSPARRLSVIATRSPADSALQSNAREAGLRWPGDYVAVNRPTPHFNRNRFRNPNPKKNSSTIPASVCPPANTLSHPGNSAIKPPAKNRR